MASQVTLRNATQSYIESGSVQFGQVKSEVLCSEWNKVPLRHGALRHFTQRYDR